MIESVDHGPDGGVPRLDVKRRCGVERALDRTTPRVDADLIPNEILVEKDLVSQHQKVGVNAYPDVDRTVRIEGDGIKLMRREFLDDQIEESHAGHEAGNGGDVLSFGERDCDVEEQDISPVHMVGDLFGPAYELTNTRRKHDRESTYEDYDTVTIVPTTEPAQARLLKRITVLIEADDHLDPNIVTIGSLGNM